jgi:hypothetical protein
MKARLQFNICGLETSYLSNIQITGLSQHIQASIFLELANSCQYWADHLDAAGQGDNLTSQIMDFLYSQLIYWLEVLSLSLASPSLLKIAR